MTRAMPIPSWHRKGAGLRAGASLLAAIVVCASTAAHAHDPGTDRLPGDAGWRLGSAAAIVLPAADDRWPAAAWPGVLIDGNAPRDQRRGLRLEHATLDLATRLNARWGGQLVVGWHDRESAHLEAASVHGFWPWRDGEIDVAMGRDTVRMGPVLDGAGHFDRFSLAPLAQRAVLNGPWIDDGWSVTWRRPEADGLRAVSAGLWRGRAFPGGTGGPAFPTLHLHAGWGHLDAHVSAARLQVRGRGASAMSAGSTGHSHTALDCAASLQQRVCFDGDVDVLGTRVQWEPDHGLWTLSLAALARRERGTLYSTSGDALHRTLTNLCGYPVSIRITIRRATRTTRVKPQLSLVPTTSAGGPHVAPRVA